MVAGTVSSGVNPIINRMRGIFALLIVAGHTFPLAKFAFAKPDIVLGLSGPFEPLLGFTWVVGFIAISGYCITLSTIRGPFSLPGYAVLRATRIYPTLLAALLLALLVEAMTSGSVNRASLWQDGISLDGFLRTAIGIAGINSTPFGSLAPSYTISYELLYYALWGIAMALFVSPRAAFAFAAITGVCAFLFSSLVTETPTTRWVLMFFLTWLLGGAVAIFQHELPKWLCRIRLSHIWLAMMFYLVVMWELDLFPSYGTFQLSSVLFYLGLSGLFALAIISALGTKAGESRIDRWLGEISYPLFVCHGPVIVFVAFCLREFDLHPNFAVCAMLMVGLSIAVSQAVLVLVERPVLRWRKALREPTPVPVLAA
jgi:peptidoglycan/LPS O-acetylase OafA/YrhL